MFKIFNNQTTKKLISKKNEIRIHLFVIGVRPVTRKKEQRTHTGYKEQIQDLTWVSISIDMRNSDLFLVSVSVPHLYTNQY